MGVGAGVEDGLEDLELDGVDDDPELRLEVAIERQDDVQLLALGAGSGALDADPACADRRGRGCGVEHRGELDVCLVPLLGGDDEGLERYSERALLRVWKAERFSWWFSGLLHRYPHMAPFDLKMQQADIAFLRDNEAQQRAFAENYVGLPY